MIRIKIYHIVNQVLNFGLQKNKSVIQVLMMILKIINANLELLIQIKILYL